MEQPFYLLPVNMEAADCSVCTPSGIRRTGWCPRRAVCLWLTCPWAHPSPFFTVSRLSGLRAGAPDTRVGPERGCPQRGTGPGRPTSPLADGDMCALRGPTAGTTGVPVSQWAGPLSLGDWLALGPAYSRCAPARLPWGGCKCPQPESQPLAGPVKGSDPGKHLPSALCPQLKSTSASGSLQKPQPVLRKLPTSSRCPTTSSTCAARLLSSGETSTKPGGGTKKPYPSVPRT